MLHLEDALLTPAQREAVEHIDGPLLILAGPGSGKTRVVTYRIAHLIDQGIPPHQIVALTFTNKAAEEMRSRVEQLASGQSISVGTFHRFCARLLRQYAGLVGLTENYTIYDSDDSLRALRRILKERKLQTDLYPPARIAHAISAAKNDLIGADRYEARPGDPLGQIMAEAYPAYQKQLLDSSAVDFDDLLLHVASMLRRNTDLRQMLDERFRYILIDEYQDTNRVQYAILRALSIDHPNLAATGDPDQSIFGWRGANVSNILDFEKDYPDVHVVRLEQNYRSTKRILQAADALIGNNVRRKPKRLFTENADGTPVRLAIQRNERIEAESIAARIADDVLRGTRRASDFAILYRINALSRTLEFALRDRGVPYQLVKGLEFFQRKEIKDVMAYLHLLNNPRNDVALLRTINTPPRGIGAKTIERLSNHAARRGLSLLDACREAADVDTLPTRAKSLVARFVAIHDQLAEKILSPLEDIVRGVLDLSGYRDYLAASATEEDEQRLANIEELLTVASQADDQSPDGASLEQFLEDTALVNDIDGWDEDPDRVTLMTMHASKGLEFPVVFIVAVEEGLLPHERSRDDPSQLEEERRLMFVAMTRAMDELQISTAQQRSFRGDRKRTVPSRFMMELPRDQMDVVESGWMDSTESWDDPHDDVDGFDEDPDDDDLVDEDPRDGETGNEPSPMSRSHASDATRITTAAQLDTSASEENTADHDAHRVAPREFQVGMAVMHPGYGLGKIAAMGGSRHQRTATVNFVTAGQHKFRIEQCPLRPLPERS